MLPSSIVAVLTFTTAFLPALGETSHTLHDDNFPADAYSVGFNPEIAHKNAPESSVERLRQELDEDTPPFATAASTELTGDHVEGEQRRRKRFWSTSESSEEEQPAADGSGYAEALDALLAYHAAVQREGRRVVDMPDMQRETRDKMLFFTITTRMRVSGVRLRVPATLQRVSSVTAESLPGVGVDMSCNVKLGDFETWGQYDVKVNGVGPSGDFETTIRDRVVHATIRFRELPATATAAAGATAMAAATAAVAVPATAAVAAPATTAATVKGTSALPTTATSAPPVDATAEVEPAAAAARCRLEATELTLVERGRDDVPAVLSRWASQVEDVPTTLRVMKQLLNERLAQFPCGDAFVAMVRRGYAAPS